MRYTENIFRSENCVKEFMDYLADKFCEKTEDEDPITNKKKKIDKYKHIIVIAHNLKGFDDQFLLKYLYESERFQNPTLRSGH